MADNKPTKKPIPDSMEIPPQKPQKKSPSKK